MKKIAADRNYRLLKIAPLVPVKDPKQPPPTKVPDPKPAQDPLTEVLKLKRQMEILNVRVRTLEENRSGTVNHLN